MGEKAVDVSCHLPPLHGNLRHGRAIPDPSQAIQSVEKKVERALTCMWDDLRTSPYLSPVNHAG